MAKRTLMALVPHARMVPRALVQTQPLYCYAEMPHQKLGQDFARQESAKDRLNRRKELETLMKVWKLKVGFEFHVQMKTKYKMFSSKCAAAFDCL